MRQSDAPSSGSKRRRIRSQPFQRRACALPRGDYVAGRQRRAGGGRAQSLADFAQTVIRARRRFHEELKKLAPVSSAASSVEGSIRDVIEGATDRAIQTRSSARPSLSAWTGARLSTSAATDRRRSSLSRHTLHAPQNTSTLLFLNINVVGWPIFRSLSVDLNNLCTEPMC